MPQRVLHILGDSGHEGTGIARLVASLHRHIDPAKYQLSACFVGSDGLLAETFRQLGIPTQVIRWRHPSRDFSGLARLLLYLRSANFDIIHFHWGGPRLRWFARRFTRARIVLHLHTCFEEISQTSLPHLSTANADSIIAVSRSVARACSHRHMCIIYSGVEPQAVASNEKRDAVTIGFAGRLVAVKGLSFLLQAMALLRERLPNLHLEIAGEGGERSRLEAEAASLRLHDSVRFLGWTDSLAASFAAWRVFIQPSLDEGLPLAVLEAMTGSLPVIASRVGGLPEIVEDGITGLLVPAADAQSLADAIRQLLADDDLSQRMGKAGAARVREQFSARHMAEQTVALYDGLLSS